VTNSILHQPEGPGDLVPITRRTLVLVAVMMIAITFFLVMALYIVYRLYGDTRDDLQLARTESSCARQVVADTNVALGQYVEEIGAMNEQISIVFKTLPTSADQDKAPFFSALQGFGSIADELHRRRILFDTALNKQSQVNEICSQKEAQP
jgi:hypothetical protein